MLGERHEEWVRAARAGDEEAFGELVRSSWPALVRSVEAAVGDHHEAQDLVQEALLRAHGRLDRLEAAEHFVPWVRRIARNVAVDRLRRRRRQLAIELVDPDSLQAAEVREADPARGAEEIEDRERRLVRLWHDIAELPPRERRLRLLYYGRGMSVGAVAEECGMSPSGVKVALHRARKSLVERTVHRRGARVLRA